MTTDTVTNITPTYLNGNNVSYAIATDGNRLYATDGSVYNPGKPAVTNVIFFE